MGPKAGLSGKLRARTLRPKILKTTVRPKNFSLFVTFSRGLGFPNLPFVIAKTKAPLKLQEIKSISVLMRFHFRNLHLFITKSETP